VVGVWPANTLLTDKADKTSFTSELLPRYRACIGCKCMLRRCASSPRPPGISSSSDELPWSSSSLAHDVPLGSVARARALVHACAVIAVAIGPVDTGEASDMTAASCGQLDRSKRGPSSWTKLVSGCS
jgi:hypothetical protein